MLGIQRCFVSLGVLTACVVFSVKLGFAQEDQGQPLENRSDYALDERDFFYAPTGYRPSLEEFARIWEEVDFIGDIRMRFETDFNRNKAFDPQGKPNDDNRRRVRYRLRFGLRYPLHEELLFETRLRSQSRENDPRDDDVTMGDGWRANDIGMDLFNLTYRPDWYDRIWIRAGKLQHFFTDNPVMGALVWDPDLNPEGAAAGLDFLGDNDLIDSFRIAAGEYISIEQDRGNDVMTFAAQASCSLTLNERIGAQAGVGYVGFTNPSPDANTALDALNAGNYMEGGTYASEFTIFDSFLAVDFDCMEIPLVISAGWMKNPGARINQDQGWTLGAAAGELKTVGDIRAYYQYQEIEQDALFTPTASADLARLTNYSGSVAGVAWRFQEVPPSM